MTVITMKSCLIVVIVIVNVIAIDSWFFYYCKVYQMVN